MAQIGNTAAFSEGDGLNTYLNLDTVNKNLQVLNGANLTFYSDGGSTITGQLNNAAQSATAVVIANAGTIATAGLLVSRLAPAASRNNIVMQPGTIPGQLCWVVNESAYANFITFAGAGTSNVADGNADVIVGGTARLFMWDSVTALWYNTDSATNVPQSPTAPAIANAGTIAITGLVVSRVSPAGAVTGIILAPGTYQGQTIWVINEAAAANSVTFNTTPATANVANSATASAIAGLTARQFVWDSVTALWYQTA